MDTNLIHETIILFFLLQPIDFITLIIQNGTNCPNFKLLKAPYLIDFSFSTDKNKQLSLSKCMQFSRRIESTIYFYYWTRSKFKLNGNLELIVSIWTSNWQFCTQRSRRNWRKSRHFSTRMNSRNKNFLTNIVEFVQLARYAVTTRNIHYIF